MKNQIDLTEIKEFVENCGPDTKIYLGCDSEIIYSNGIEYVDYTIAVVVHIDGKYGCRVFGQVDRERNYEKHRNRPRMRLMNEVYRAADMYLKLVEVVDIDIEVHLDINPNEMYNSNVVLNEAIGYIKGVCNVIPVVKPDAIAASGAADKLKRKLLNI
jgi:hypothetical protein